MPPNLRAVVAQVYRGGYHQAVRNFSSPSPLRSTKGDVSSIFSQKKRLFSAEPETDPFYRLEFDGSIESVSKWEKRHMLDFSSSCCMDEIPEKEVIARAIDRMSESRMSENGGDLELALKVYYLAKEKGLLIRPSVGFRLIKSLARNKKADESKILLQGMISKGSSPGSEIFNEVIYACSKTGDADGARDLLKQMESLGLVPDVYTYTLVISSYAKRGFMDQAQEVLEEAKQRHQKLSPVTFQVLLQGFFKAGQYEDIAQLFEDSGCFGVKPRGDEYIRLIQSFCLVEMDWKSAEKLHTEMKLKDLLLDPITKGYIDSLRAMDPYAPTPTKGEDDLPLSYLGQNFTTIYAEFLAVIAEVFHNVLRPFPKLVLWCGRILLWFDNARLGFWGTVLRRSNRKKKTSDQEDPINRVSKLFAWILVAVFLFWCKWIHEVWKKIDAIYAENLKVEKEKKKIEEEKKREQEICAKILQTINVPSITYPDVVWKIQRESKL